MSTFSVDVDTASYAIVRRGLTGGRMPPRESVRGEELSSTVFPIAYGVQIRVEFNPVRVVEYRVTGYATPMLKREDFNDDKVDAGDIGAGHTVRAIYEIAPVGAKQRQLDPLRYPQEGRTSDAAVHGSLR